MKKRMILVSLIIGLFLIAANMTDYWYLLEGNDAYVICPTRFKIERLAPNAVHLVCVP